MLLDTQDREYPWCRFDLRRFGTSSRIVHPDQSYVMTNTLCVIGCWMELMQDPNCIIHLLVSVRARANEA